MWIHVVSNVDWCNVCFLSRLGKIYKWHVYDRYMFWRKMKTHVLSTFVSVRWRQGNLKVVKNMIMLHIVMYDGNSLYTIFRIGNIVSFEKNIRSVSRYSGLYFLLVCLCFWPHLNTIVAINFNNPFA